MKSVKMGVLVFSAMMMSASAHADVLYAKAKNWINLSGYGWLQHVYVCAGRPSYGFNETCKANPGKGSSSSNGSDLITGGSYLSDTLNTGSTSKMLCAADFWKFGCPIAWGVTGTCQQGANRMLYTASRTVSKAGGYSISSRLFGTYGSPFDWYFCKKSCAM